MTLEDRICQAEKQVFEAAGLTPEATFVDLPRTGARLRVLSFGSGQPLVLLHGLALGAASWAPLVGDLAGYRAHAVDLPGHGLSDRVAYRRGAVRDHALQLIDDLYEALGVDAAPVVGHSLGGMFALWHAAERPGRISSLAVLAAPAVAIPGTTVRMPLSPMTVPVLGPAMLRSPSPRPLFRQLIAQGLGPGAAAAMPPELLEVLRLAGRRSGNARTVASLMHAINRFRRPRTESVMDADELGRVTVPTAFVWGTEDRYLAPGDARPWIEQMPAATLHEVPGGHGPHFEDPAGCVELITRHFAATGYPPAGRAGSSRGGGSAEGR